MGYLRGKRVKRKFNITKKDRGKNYLKDINISRVIEILYKKDQILYEKLKNSPEGFLEYSYSFLKDFSV